MTAFVTFAAGNWSTTTNWTPNGTPGNGDTVTINHNMIVDQATIIGSSPATGGTAAINWGSNGRTLTINANLTLRGDISPQIGYLAAPDIISVAAGVTIEFDTSQAAAPSTTVYKWTSPNSNQGWRITFNGTLAQPCILRSNASGNNCGYFEESPNFNRPSVHATFTNFLRIGNATTFPIDKYYGTDSASNELYLHDCVFDTCGRVVSRANNIAGAVIDLTRVTFKNGVDSQGVDMDVLHTNPAASNITDCYLGLQISVEEGAGWSFSGNTFASGHFVGTASPTASTLHANNLVVFNQPGHNEGICCGTYLNDYFIATDATNVNPHGVTLNYQFAHDMDGIVWEGAYPTEGDGDLIFIGPTNPGGVQTYNIVRNILLPAADGTSFGKLISLLYTGSNWRLNADHNTVVADYTSPHPENGVVQCGESGGGLAGMISSLRSNLIWSSTTAHSTVLNRLAGSLQDVVSSANVSYTGMWNPYTGFDGPGFQSGPVNASLFTSGTPNLNSVTIGSNPFVDNMRRLSTWAGSIGATATNQGALDALRRRIDWTDGAYNPANGATPSAAVTWVKAGWRVTNAALKNAGSDGVTIGALPFTFITPTLSAISPGSGAQGTVASVTITGTNLTGTTAVNVSGSGISVGPLTVTSTTVTVNFTIGQASALGAYTVSATNPAGTSNTVNFTVTTLSASTAIPYLIGSNYPDACQLLSALGLTVMVDEIKSGIPVGVVLGQTPAAGSAIVARQPATITVSRGSLPAIDTMQILPIA